MNTHCEPCGLPGLERQLKQLESEIDSTLEPDDLAELMKLIQDVKSRIKDVKSAEANKKS